MRTILCALFLCLFATAASAHHYRHHEHHYRHRVHYSHSGEYLDESCRISRCGFEHHASDPRPSQWCSWWLRQTLGVPLGVINNLALSWLHWGHPSRPEIGAVVIWSRGHGHGHVGIIRGGPDSRGRWLIESGNDGHAVRTRYRSIAGAVGIRA